MLTSDSRRRSGVGGGPPKFGIGAISLAEPVETGDGPTQAQRAWESAARRARWRAAPAPPRWRRWSGTERTRPPIRPARAASTAAWNLLGRLTWVTTPARPTRAANRCWWPSTCSPRAGSRGTQIGTWPAPRASMIVPGPPWTTAPTPRPAARRICSCGRKALPSATGARLLSPCWTTNRSPGRRRAASSTQSTSRSNGWWSVPDHGEAPAAHSKRSHQIGRRVEGELLLPLDDPPGRERPAEPAGHGRRVDPVVDLDEDGRDPHQPGHDEERDGDTGAGADHQLRAARDAAAAPPARGCARCWAGCGSSASTT